MDFDREKECEEVLFGRPSTNPPESKCTKTTRSNTILYHCLLGDPGDGALQPCKISSDHRPGVFEFLNLQHKRAPIRMQHALIAHYRYDMGLDAAW